eukprot:m.238426 g.238426  ORF g.238426 m.238426 type:complete len:471 (+) comp21771_c0_seq1:135-1547(+)
MMRAKCFSVFLLVFMLLGVAAVEFEEEGEEGPNINEEDWLTFYHPLVTSNPSTFYLRCGQYDAQRDQEDAQRGRVHLFADFEAVQRATLHNISVGLPFKAVVYHCDEAESICGGFGERMRGAISAFFLAVLTKRAFFIHAPYPADLNAFIRPLRREFTSWSLPKGWNQHHSRLRIKEQSFTTSDEGTETFASFSSRLKTAPFTTLLADTDVLLLRTNIFFAMELALRHTAEDSEDSENALGRLGNLFLTTHANNLPYCLLNYVFHPSHAVLSEVHRVGLVSTAPMVERTATYVAVHVRTGGKSWTDPDRVPLRALSHYLDCARARRDVLLRDYPQLKSVTYFVASDMPEIVAHARSVLGPNSTLGDTTLLEHTSAFIHPHTSTATSGGGKGTRHEHEKRREAAAAGVMRVMVEHVLLSAAPELVLSPSGLSHWSYARQHTLAYLDDRREWPFEGDAYTECRQIPGYDETR